MIQSYLLCSNSLKVGVSRHIGTGGDDLDPSQHKLKQILGHYIEKEWKPCGLSNCHQLHGKGYYVVTESGLETNIGKDCGKKYLDCASSSPQTYSNSLGPRFAVRK